MSSFCYAVYAKNCASAVISSSTFIGLAMCPFIPAFDSCHFQHIVDKREQEIVGGLPPVIFQVHKLYVPLQIVGIQCQQKAPVDILILIRRFQSGNRIGKSGTGDQRIFTGIDSNAGEQLMRMADLVGYTGIRRTKIRTQIKELIQELRR